MNTDLFALAFKLWALGFSVIPSGGGEKAKNPRVGWKEYQQRQPTEDELHQWQDNLKPQLWGIVTGARSGVVVVDADSSEPRAELEAELGPPHVITPRGGGHWYLKHPGHLIKTVAGLLPGMDIRGDGGFANIAGASKKGEYRIATLPAPGSLLPWSRLPQKIKVALDGSKPAPAPATPEGEAIPEGKRNRHLTSLAGSMRRRGMPQSAIEAGLLAFNRTQCQPPLPEGEVVAIAKSIAVYEPQPRAVSLRRMADVEAEAVSWLWPPYIPQGKLTLLEGDPGIGKSWVTLAIATAVSLGKGLPGQEPSEPANVVIASAEDGLGDTIRPRLDAMGADSKRIFAIDGALTLDENGFALLESYLERVRPVLLIIDPLVAYLGAGVDIFRANETRAVMAQLARLGEKFCVAILAVRHLTKGGKLKAIYRGLGSIDLTAACRSVLLAGCDAENPRNRALVHIKSNLALAGPAIGYELREDDFYWTGESTLTAAQILAAECGAGDSELDEAIAFLKDELAEGPAEASQVFKDARDMGFSEKTIKRAKAKLAIKTRRHGETGRRGGGKFIWRLPDSHLEAPEDLEGQEGHVKQFDPLNPFSFRKADRPTEVGPLNTKTPNHYEAVLGVPVDKVIDIWRSQGAPVIHLGPRENCFDLDKLLSRPDVPGEHLLAVRRWLDKVREVR